MNKIIKNTLYITTIAGFALAPVNVYAMSQDETVYAKLQPSGDIDYLSVSKHLLNDLRDAKLNDKSILKNIENVNGFENYEINGENLIWNAEGSDIYYSGKTDKDLPIQVSVTYKLNGEEKSIEEILGKSGQVEISLQYKNLSKVGDLYTPFVVGFSTTLPENTVHNVHVTNGKVISNGRNLMIAAIAAPGLYDSLKIDEVKSLDNITLTYETDKFELNDIYNLVTPKILDEDDLKVFDEIDKLSSGAAELSNGSRKLVNGTNKLKDGIQELRQAITSARAQIDDLNVILDNKTLANISDTAARAARQKVSEQRQDIYNTISQQVSSMMPDSSLIQQLATLKPAMIEQQKLAACNKIAAANPAIDPTSCSLDADAILNAADPTLIDQITAGVNAQIDGLATQFDQKAITDKLFNSTYGAIQNVAEETAATTARTVATQLASSIQEGISENLNTLMDMLIGGIDQLLDGATELNNGMQQFDHNGIQELNNTVNGKIKNTSDTMKQLVKLADQYNNFSGIADDTNGTTKFILMIEGRKQK